jgi:hypothetical protein
MYLQTSEYMISDEGMGFCHTASAPALRKLEMYIAALPEHPMMTVVGKTQL